MGTLTTSVVFARQFIQHFAAFFSSKQLAALLLALLGWFLEYSRFSLLKLAEKAGIAYASLRYLLFRSKWDALPRLNQVRLEVILSDKRTRCTKRGVIVIDDTGSVKKFSLKIEGVARQYSGSAKGVEKCLVSVMAAYADPHKRFPIEWRPYRVEGDFPLGKADPKFRDKIDLALEILRRLAQDPRFPKIAVVDAWYMACKLIEEADRLGFCIIGEIDADRKFLFRRPDTQRYEYMKRDELVKLVRQYYSHRLKCLDRRDKDGKPRRVWYFSFTTKLHKCPVPVRAVLILGPHFQDDKPDTARLLVSTKPALTAKEIIEKYDLRWGIETCFRELKETFYFDQFQVRSLVFIERFWFLAVLAWTLAYCMKQRGILKKTVDIPPDEDTLAGHAGAYRKLLNFEHGRRLVQTGQDVQHYSILSQKAIQDAS